MKLNWGASMAIVYSIFAIIMVIFAVKASQIKYDLVTENYYDEAVKYQDRIDENANAQNASSKLSFNYNTNSKSLLVNVTGSEKELSGKLSFYKPDKASNDFAINFQTDASGIQSIPLQNLSHGYWRVTANYVVNGKNCLEQKRIFIP